MYRKRFSINGKPLLEFIEDGERFRYLSKSTVIKKEKLALVIGSGSTKLVNYLNGIESNTSYSQQNVYPYIYSSRLTDFSYVTCPFLEKPTNSALDVSNLYFRSSIFVNANKIKFLLLVSKESDFYDVIKSLQSVFVYFSNMSEEVVQSIQRSICILLTDIDDGMSFNSIQEALLGAVEGYYDIEPNILQALKVALKRNFQIFNYLENDSKKNQILNMLYSIQYIQINEIKPIYYYEHSDDLSKYMRYEMDNLKNEVTEFIKSNVLNYAFQTLVSSFTDDDVDRVLLTLGYLHQMGMIDEKSSLFEFVKNIDFLDEEIRMRYFIIDKITVSMAGICKFDYEIKWITDPFLMANLEKWLMDLTKLKKFQPICTVENNTLIYRSFKPRLTDLTQILYQHRNIKSIRIYGIETVIINDDLALPSVDVYLIAPVIKVYAMRKIDLSGNDIYPDDYPNDIKKAQNGEDGLGAKGIDGLAGKIGSNGGNLFLFCNELRDSNNLMFVSNGGKGGPGQDGGNGGEGSKGEDGLESNIKHEKKYYLREYVLDEKYPEIALQVYGIRGKPGGKGGQGGRGGQGGCGGLGGSVICSLEKYSLYSQRTLHGADGANGKPGLGGLGGYYGDTPYKYFIDSKGNDELIMMNIPITEQDKNDSLDPYFAFFDRSRKDTKWKRGESGNQRLSYDLTPNVKPRKEQLNTYQSKTEYLIFFIQFHKDLAAIDFFRANFYITLDEDTQFLPNSVTELYDRLFMIQSQEYELKNKNEKHIKQFIELYRTCQRDIRRFYEVTNKKGMIKLSQGELTFMNVMYFLCSSNLCRLNGLNETSIVLDMSTFIVDIRDKISELKTLEVERVKDIYKANYTNSIQSRIDEANKFIEILMKDIKNKTEETNRNIKAIIKEIEKISDEMVDKDKKLLEQKEKLRRNMVLRTILDGLKIGFSLLSLFGPEAAVVGQLVNTGLDIGKSFIKDSDDGRFPSIPKDLKDSVNGISKLIKEYKTNNIEDIENSVKILEAESKKKQASVPSTNNSNEKPLENRIKDLPDTLKKLELQLQYATIKGDKKEWELNEMKEIIQKYKIDKGIGIMSNTVNTFLTAGQMGIDLYNDVQASDDAIKKVDEQINSNKKQYEALYAGKVIIQELYVDTIVQMNDEFDKLSESLQNASKVSLNVRQWQIKRKLGDLNKTIAQMTKSLESGDAFSSTIQHMQDSIQTLVSIYEQIEDYKDRKELAEFIGSVSGTSTDAVPQELRSKVNDMKLASQLNITLDLYNKARSAFKQWAFPFADRLMRKIDDELKSNIYDQENDDRKPEYLIEFLQRLNYEVKRMSDTLTPSEDNFIQNEIFESSSQTAFYEWSIKAHTDELRQFFSGKSMILNADISKAQYDAVKFSSIYLRIVLVDDENKNAQLQELLNNFKIKMTHAGSNFYRFKNKVYRMESNGINTADTLYFVKLILDYEKPKDLDLCNETAKKLALNKPLLSPYTSWLFQLEPKRPSNTNKYSEIINLIGNSNITMYLEGKGQYVDDDIQLDSGTEDIEIFYKSYLGHK